MSVRTLRAAIAADHEMMRSTRERYPTHGSSMQAGSMLRDGVQKIGFQMLIAVRVMHWVRDRRIPLGGQLLSRLIRHLYGAEIHWEAAIAPGVSIVHGNGLVISHAATVGPGCILFQNVTLGESIDPVTREVGGPTLERDVHVGPGATLLGPITIGAGTKILANSVVDRSVPAGSIVRGAPIVVTSRGERSDAEREERP
jgi:serine acetyltransferase